MIDVDPTPDLPPDLDRGLWGRPRVAVRRRPRPRPGRVALRAPAPARRLRIGAGGVVALGVFGEADVAEPRRGSSSVVTYRHRIVDRPAGRARPLRPRRPPPSVDQARQACLEAVPPSAGRPDGRRSTSPTAADVLVQHFTAIHEATGLAASSCRTTPPCRASPSPPTSWSTSIAAACAASSAGVKAESAPTSARDRALWPPPSEHPGVRRPRRRRTSSTSSAAALGGRDDRDAAIPKDFAPRSTRHDTGGFDAAHAAPGRRGCPLANFEGQVRVGLGIRKEVLRRRGVLGHRPHPGAAQPAARPATVAGTRRRPGPASASRPQSHR